MVGHGAMNMSPAHVVLLAAALLLSACAGLKPAETGALPPNAANVWSPSMEARRVALEKAAQGSGIVVLRTPDDQLQVNVPSEFSFDTDSAAIRPGMRPVLDAFAVDMKAEGLSAMLIHVIGFTDGRGGAAANDTLSLARAVSVRKYLEGRGIAAARISVEGRGESQPLVDDGQAYGRALNRRVEIVLREPARAP